MVGSAPGTGWPWRLSDQTLPEAPGRSVEPGGVDRGVPAFHHEGPSISAAVAARDPSGEILIVTYDLPLDEVAKFTTTVRPSPRGLMFVLTDDGRLLGPPRDNRGNNKPDANVPTLQPVAESASPHVKQAVAKWQADRKGRSDRFRLTLEDETWWAGFTPFEFGSGHRFWIGVLLPRPTSFRRPASTRRSSPASACLALLAAACGLASRPLVLAAPG